MRSHASGAANLAGNGLHALFSGFQHALQWSVGMSRVACRGNVDATRARSALRAAGSTWSASIRMRIKGSARMSGKVRWH